MISTLIVGPQLAVTLSALGDPASPSASAIYVPVLRPSPRTWRAWRPVTLRPSLVLLPASKAAPSFLRQARLAVFGALVDGASMWVTSFRRTVLVFRVFRVSSRHGLLKRPPWSLRPLSDQVVNLALLT